MSRAEVAAFLREFVEELEGEGDTVATGVEQGGQHADHGDRRGEGDTTGRSDASTAGQTGTGAGTGGDRTRQVGEGRKGAPAGDARRVTFVIGGDSATVTIPEMVDFDVEVESRSPLLQSGESQAVEFHLSWEIEEQAQDDSIDLK